MTRTWIEVAGVVSVVVSLVFVGLELQQNTEAVKAANHFSLLELVFSNVNTVVADPELSAIASAIASGTDAELAGIQQTRAQLLREQYINVWEAAFYNHRSGQIDTEIWDAWDAYYRGSMTSSAWSWWDENRTHFGVSFQAHVAALRSRE